MGDPMGGLDFQSLMAQAGSSGGLPNMDDLVRHRQVRVYNY